MENKFFIFGIIFLLAILVLGCTQSEDATETEVNSENEAQSDNYLSDTEIDEIVEDLKEAPVYDAPLTGSTDKTCEVDEDCLLIKYRTGVGIMDDCLGPNADYEGVATEDCECKVIGQTTQYESDGTEETVLISECRHI